MLIFENLSFVIFLKVFIYGGFVSNELIDIVEVFDTNKKTIEPLTDTNGAKVQIASLTNLAHSCSVVLEEQNSILVIGGMKYNALLGQKAVLRIGITEPSRGTKFRGSPYIPK